MKRQTGRIGMILMSVLVITIMGLFVLQFVQIQIVNEGYYVEQRYDETSVSREIQAARGEILLSDGTPIVRNRTVNNVVLDAAMLPENGENEVILKTTKLLEKNSEDWLDTLPISTKEPFVFQEGMESEVAKLKKELDKQEYATVDDILDKLYEKYKLKDDKQFTNEEKRRIAGVRYEMERQDFSLKYSFTLAENVSLETTMKISEGNLYFPGVRTEETSIREYANGTFAPHIWGVMGPIYKEDKEKYEEAGYNLNEQVGKGGLEETFESTLRGKKGKSRVSTNAQGDILSTEVEEEAVPGNSIVTTIDPKLQLIAQQSLEKNITKLQKTAPAGKGREADIGAVVVLDSKTGAIKALAQYPTYDINEYRTKYNEILSRKGQPLFNRTLYGKYAPGSCYKPLIALAGLNEGVIEEDSKVSCNVVYTFYDDYRPKCLSRHGAINVKTALQKSCNVFFYDTGRILGIERINNYARKFGLESHTGIEIKEDVGILAGTEAAMAKRVDPWVPGDVLQAAIGQGGNEFTPLQLANYTNTIANDGVLKEAHLIDSVVSYNGDKVVSKTETKVVSNMNVKKEHFDVVKEGMRMASTTGGTSMSYLGTFPFPVASKTGTPQTGLNTQNSVYITFAPIDNPEITIVTIIENGWHGYTGAPVAGDIYRAYFFDDYADYDINLETAVVKTDEEPVED